jgi:diguanylate cyclase (GGDEF)-like protein
MQVMARAYLDAPQKGDACRLYLTDVMSGMPWLKGLTIAAPDGRIACSTTPGGAGLNLSDRPHFRTAMTERKFVLSSYVVGRLNLSPTVVAAYPILDGAQVRGVVLASINLQSLGQSHAISTHADAGALMIDGHGTILAAHAGLEAWIGKRPASHPLIREMLSHPQGTITTTDLDGVRRIFAFLTIPWTDAHYAVGLDEAAILARVKSQVGAAYLQLAFFALLALFVAWVAGERLIVEPLRLMARKVAMFGRGNLDVRSEPGRWMAEFVPLVKAFDDMASRLAERERELRTSNDHLTELASLDGLSGLANRRSFDARLDEEWQRALTTREPLSLLMIDVDRFKLFNDHYGHVEGDVCLRRIAQTLAVAASEPDFVARYGGEEFAVLLRNTDGVKAKAVAERLRVAVERLGIKHAAAPRGLMTLSAGVACLNPANLDPGSGASAAALVEAADAALYVAKRNGRNAVASAPGLVVADAALLAKAS